MQRVAIFHFLKRALQKKGNAASFFAKSRTKRRVKHRQEKNRNPLR
jgi:hypothetical protein